MNCLFLYANFTNDVIKSETPGCNFSSKQISLLQTDVRKKRDHALRIVALGAASNRVSALHKVKEYWSPDTACVERTVMKAAVRIETVYYRGFALPAVCYKGHCTKGLSKSRTLYWHCESSLSYMLNLLISQVLFCMKRKVHGFKTVFFPHIVFFSSSKFHLAWWGLKMENCNK